MNALKWIWSRIAGMRLSILGVCMLGLLRVGASLTFVWISKVIVDVATRQSDAHSSLVTLGAVMVGLLLTEMALNLAINYVSGKNEVRLKNSLRERSYGVIMRSRLDSSAHIHSGDLLSRLMEDVRVISDAVCSKLPQVFIMCAQLLGAFAMLYFMSPVLAVCVLCIMPICLGLGKIYVRRMRSITADIRRADSNIQTDMQEGLQHRLVVKTLECADMLYSRLDGLQRKLYSEMMRRTRFSTFSRAMVRIGFIAGFLTTFLWCIWHLHTGSITFGTMTAFLQLVSRIQNPMVNLSHFLPSFVQGLTSIDRLMELDSLPAECSDEHKLLGSSVGIRLTSVDFTYPGRNVPVLSDVNLDFAPGSKTVVMGETGVGKSTLMKLILGVLTPSAGSVTLYADSTEAPADASTRCNITYVPQGNSLLAGTIKDNLLLGNPAATEAEIADALHIAAADFVFDLPDGLSTRCGEHGAQLSEGQAQRIAIARALLRNRPVMLLDEFNSALDADTASAIMERLAVCRSHCTIIYISHRPEVRLYCDNTVRLA